MENIIVVDNFLQNDELTQVKHIIKNSKWEYNHTSNGNKDIEIPFWSCYLNDNEYFTIYLKNIIEKQFFKKFTITRVYANGQTFGQDGAFHKDTENENGNDYTFCLYINDIPHYDIEMASGYIIFKIPDLKYKICYEPINNRGILFPSHYIHKPTAFSRFIKDLRVCIAFKLQEIIT